MHKIISYVIILLICFNAHPSSSMQPVYPDLPGVVRTIEPALAAAASPNKNKRKKIDNKSESPETVSNKEKKIDDDNLFSVVTHVADIQRIIIAYAYTNTWQALKTISPKAARPQSVCYIRGQANTLALGFTNGLLELYNLDQNICVGTTGLNQYAHRKKINDITTISPHLFATASEDGTIKLWNSANLPHLICEGTVADHNYPVESLVWGKDQLISRDAGSRIKLWNLSPKKTLTCSKTIEHSTVSAICASPDGYYVASGGHDSTIKIWNTRTGLLISDVPKTDEEGGIACISWLPCNKTLVSAHDCGKVKRIDVSRITSPQSITYIDQEDFLMHTAQLYIPHAEQIIIGNIDGNLKIWNTKNNNLDQTLKHHTDKINALAASPGGRYLAACADDGTVSIWEHVGLKLAASVAQSSHKMQHA